MADQHQREHSQTLPGEGVALLSLGSITVTAADLCVFVCLLARLFFAGRRCSATTRRLTTLSLLARPPSSLPQGSRLTTGNGLALKKETNASKRASAKMLFRFRLFFCFCCREKKKDVNLVVSDFCRNVCLWDTLVTPANSLVHGEKPSKRCFHSLQTCVLNIFMCVGAVLQKSRITFF